MAFAGAAKLRASVDTARGSRTSRRSRAPWTHAGNVRDLNGDGKVNYADAGTQARTSLVDDAHKAGLFMHAHTFRNEQRRLAFDYTKDPKAEYLQFYRLGLDGVFSHFPDTALEARLIYLKALGR